MVPAGPLRQWLTAWAITTGDPLDVIAQGFDLDATLVAELLGSEPPRMLDSAVARKVCRKLRLDPTQLWPPHIARLVGPCNWPDRPCARRCRPTACTTRRPPMTAGVRDTGSSFTSNTANTANTLYGGGAVRPKGAVSTATSRERSG